MTRYLGRSTNERQVRYAFLAGNKISVELFKGNATGSENSHHSSKAISCCNIVVTEFGLGGKNYCEKDMNNIEKNLEKIFEKLNITNEWETRKAAMNDLGKIAAKGTY